ncbi:MAG: VCBS repeat-containing protein [Acidobacteriota bacterium]|nr:VCBS repeat-containing protein [Acidobacteriota bacterium]MDH3785706.1 VCBS repeat-containing protein [Acidobacteriota bacterium]
MTRRCSARCFVIALICVGVPCASGQADIEESISAPLGLLAEWTSAGGLNKPPTIFTQKAMSTDLTANGLSRRHGSFLTTFGKPHEQAPRLKATTALRKWTSTHSGAVSLKPISFDRHDSRNITTLIRVEVSGQSGKTLLYEVSHWQVGWQRPSKDVEDRAWRISRITRQSTERVTTRGTAFVDRTASVMGDLVDAPDIALGSEYWFGRIDNLGEPHLMGHQGIAIGDLNGDGLEDVYVAMGTGLPNRLLIRQPDGTVVDRADDAGVAWLDDTKGVLIVDTDNDGDRDLVTAVGNTIVLAKNDGAARFENFVRMKAPTSAPFYGLSAADFDGDGDLDLYGVRYIEQDYGVSIPLPFHDANNGPSNHLMRNEGDDRFADVTIAVGLDQNNRRFSLVGAWADYDNDGDADLYVANDFGRNNLYLNDGGRFTDVAASMGIEDQAAGMGASWSDFDADGDLDLYVTNMYSAAGRRIAYQPEFQTDVDASQRSAIRGYSLGNSLFVNDASGFVERGDQAGVRMGRWGWGGIFVDWDNDSQDDLVLPNGFVSGALDDDL